jgi:hypothetical protein
LFFLVELERGYDPAREDLGALARIEVVHQLFDDDPYVNLLLAEDSCRRLFDHRCRRMAWASFM